MRVSVFREYLGEFHSFESNLFFWTNRPLILYKTGYFLLRSIESISFEKMKSKDMQTLVFTKYRNGDGPTQISHDLCGTISLSTIERWCKSVRETGGIALFKSTGRPRTIRTKESIQKVKNRLKQRKTVSSRKLARELGISRTSVQRIIKNDLGRHAY